MFGTQVHSICSDETVSDVTREQRNKTQRLNFSHRSIILARAVWLIELKNEMVMRFSQDCEKCFSHNEVERMKDGSSEALS